MLRRRGWRLCYVFHLWSRVSISAFTSFTLKPHHFHNGFKSLTKITGRNDFCFFFFFFINMYCLKPSILFCISSQSLVTHSKWHLKQKSFPICTYTSCACAYCKGPHVCTCVGVYMCVSHSCGMTVIRIWHLWTQDKTCDSPTYIVSDSNLDQRWKKKKSHFTVTVKCWVEEEIKKYQQKLGN